MGREAKFSFKFASQDDDDDDDGKTMTMLDHRLFSSTLHFKIIL